MAASIFWDTNIVVDIIDRRPYELEATESIFSMAHKRDIRLFISETVITTTLYVSASADITDALLQVLKVAEVLPVSAPIISTALSSAFKDKEDAILYYLALHHKMDAFITRDKKDFTPFASALLPVLSPEDFMRLQQ